MPFLRPSLPELRARARTSIRSRLGIGPLLARSALGVLGDVIAGGVHHLYAFLVWASRQTMADTAENEELDRHASLWGLQRNAATKATGSVSVESVHDHSI